MTERPFWQITLGVFALALALRLIALLELSGSPLVEVLLGDSRGYVTWASEIAEGNWRGDGVFYQAPLYPYFLAVVFKLFGPGLEAIRIVQSMLGAAGCALVAIAAAQFFNRRAGMLAGLLMAVYPPAIFFDIVIQKTSVAFFLMAALLAVLSRFRDTQSVRWPLLAGVALGALVLTRENAMALVPCVGLWIFTPWFGDTLGNRAIRLALFIAGTALVLVPIGARNLAQGDQFLITTSQLGPNLYIGNHPGADGRYQPLVPNRGDVRLEKHDARLLAERAMQRRLTPGEVSDYWVARTLRDIGRDPWRWTKLLAHKSYMVVNAEEIADTESIEAYADESFVVREAGRLLHFGVLFPLAMMGVWATRARWRELIPLLLIMSALAASVAAFFVMARYRFPLVPLLAMFAGAALAALRERRGVPDQPPFTVGWVIAGVAAIVSNAPLGVAQEPRAVTQYNVATAMLMQERFEEAQEFLEKAARITVQPVVHLTLGSVLAERGAHEEAVDHYLKMLELQRADPLELHKRLAASYTLLANSQEADRHSALAGEIAQQRRGAASEGVEQSDD